MRLGSLLSQQGLAAAGLPTLGMLPSDALLLVHLRGPFALLVVLLTGLLAALGRAARRGGRAATDAAGPAI